MTLRAVVVEEVANPRPRRLRLVRSWAARADAARRSCRCGEACWAPVVPRLSSICDDSTRSVGGLLDLLAAGGGRTGASSTVSRSNAVSDSVSRLGAGDPRDDDARKVRSGVRRAGGFLRRRGLVGVVVAGGSTGEELDLDCFWLRVEDSLARRLAGSLDKVRRLGLRTEGSDDLEVTTAVVEALRLEEWTAGSGADLGSGGWNVVETARVRLPVLVKEGEGDGERVGFCSLRSNSSTISGTNGTVSLSKFYDSRLWE
ncbi:hypothetical protein BC937DRAFT_90571 [Endogone sp. FLAS-F59071]|nr:hypothetical protein BC937DRAFT_90571 [Endogone sp. FLAS-F59071]|eukprot:RUS16990.1 hypothetical protein BC937DRAFT_90571 [Endogone sp. FLAS-F59071]